MRSATIVLAVSAVLVRDGVGRVVVIRPGHGPAGFDVDALG